LRFGPGRSCARRSIAIPFALALATVSAACASNGGSAGPTSIPSTCSPSGSQAALAAHDIAFRPDFLCAPDRRLVIQFDNQDPGIPHNVSIFSDKAEKHSILKTPLLTGNHQATYPIPPLKPGTYWFRCDVHPAQMQGVLLVVAG
jgi:plastocyanin